MIAQAERRDQLDIPMKRKADAPVVQGADNGVVTDSREYVV
jgi:hypothetical protein